MAPSIITPLPLTAPRTAPFKVLIIGGAYAGLGAATNLLDLCSARRHRFDYTTDPLPSESKIPVEITIVDERDGYMHLIGNPLALSSLPYASKAWSTFSSIPALRNTPTSFLHGTITSLSLSTRTASFTSFSPQNPSIPQKSRTLDFDFCILATGLRRTWPTVPMAPTKAIYLADAERHIARVKAAGKGDKLGVVVIGGGAVGIEMASELKHIYPELTVKLVHSRARLLSAEPLPDEFAAAAAELLEKLGVEVVLGSRVRETRLASGKEGEEGETWAVELENGEVIRAGLVINAISGQKPTGLETLPAECCDADGWVKISSNLVVAGQKAQGEGEVERIFCAGDTVKWSGIKRAGAAMWMGCLAARNVHQRMLVLKGEKRMGDVKDAELVEIEPMMALSVAEEGVGYSKAQGVSKGREVREMMFGDDLGWGICWNYMKLGEETKM